MNFTEEIGIVMDALAYVHSYAPDFPEEDRTDLAGQARQIIERFDAVMVLARGGTRRKWLRFAREEIVTALRSFPSDEAGGCRHIEDALAFIRRAVRNVAPRAPFIIRPDGVIEHTPRQLNTGYQPPQ